MINDVKHFFQLLIVYMYIVFLKFYLFIYLAPGKRLEPWALRLKCGALPVEVSSYL